MTDATLQAAPRALSVSTLRTIGVVALLTAISGLFFYKWGGSYRAVTAVQTGQTTLSADPLLLGSMWSSTLAYFQKVWLALVYGVVISALLRVVVPAQWVAQRLGSKGVGTTLTATLIGAPLMLCSCCVSPLFAALSQRGARLGPSLSVMLAAPGLNLAALTLTFALLPAPLGLARVAGALALIFIAAPLIGRALEKTLPPVAESCELPATDELQAMTASAFGRKLIQSLGETVKRTLPVMVAGVALSALLLPLLRVLGQPPQPLLIGLVAVLGVLVALPSFFELPLALLLFEVDPTGGAAAAFLIAGPIINLPSLIIIARESKPRVALWLGAATWLVATTFGLALSAFPR